MPDYITRGGLSLAERNQLIVENLGVVEGILAHAKYRSFVDSLGYEEARSVAYTELVNRAETFSPAKAVNRHTGQPIAFSNYAWRAIATAIIREALARQKEQ